MTKSEYLKAILSDVFGTQKISLGSMSEKNLSRTKNYFRQCSLNDSSRSKFDSLFEIALNIENSQYETSSGIKKINKEKVCKNFNNHLVKFYNFSIEIIFCLQMMNFDINVYEFDENINTLINIAEIISPEIFCGNRSDEINIGRIKAKILKFINLPSKADESSSQLDVESALLEYSKYITQHVQYESMWMLLSEQEISELYKNIEYYNKRINESDDSDMGMMTLKEYITKLERDSIKFYRNISLETLEECLKTAENTKTKFFSTKKNYSYFDDLSSTLDTYILKLKRTIERQR